MDAGKWSPDRTSFGADVGSTAHADYFRIPLAAVTVSVIWEMVDEVTILCLVVVTQCYIWPTVQTFTIDPYHLDPGGAGFDILRTVGFFTSRLCRLVVGMNNRGEGGMYLYLSAGTSGPWWDDDDPAGDF